MHVLLPMILIRNHLRNMLELTFGRINYKFGTSRDKNPACMRYWYIGKGADLKVFVVVVLLWQYFSRGGIRPTPSLRVVNVWPF
jgi:hypothetical protein